MSIHLKRHCTIILKSQLYYDKIIQNGVVYLNKQIFNNPFEKFDFKKYRDKQYLKSESNGLGFYIFSYTMTMTISAFAIMLIMSLIMPNNDDWTNTTSIPMFLMQIFCAVIASFIPGLFYFLISKKRIADTILVKPIKASYLIPIVFMGMAVAMVANIAADIVNNNFGIFNLKNTVSMDSSSQSVTSNILYIISTALVPAFSEEFAFRGIVMGSLRKYGDAFAIITSAVMFGLMHGNIVQIPFAFILGLIFGYAACKTNSIVPAIIIHFINNFYAVILDILQSSEILNERDFHAVYYLIIAAFCLFGVISFIYLLKKDRSFFRISDKPSPYFNSDFRLSLKEKNTAFFLSAGVLSSIVFFLFEIIISLGVING